MADKNFSPKVLPTLLLLALLAGCSGPSQWLPSGDDKGNKSEAIRKSLVAQPGQPTGLQKSWDRSLAGSPDNHFSHPGRFAVTNNDLFVATFQGYVLRLSRKDGETLWKKEVGKSVKGGLAVDTQRVFVGTDDGEMVALSRDKGEELWRQRVSTSVASSPSVADGKLFFTTLDNRLYALNAETGATAWVSNTTPEILVIMGAAPPTVDGDRIYVGYSSGEVFALAIANGKPLWNDNLTVVGGRTELDLLQDVDADVVTDGRSAVAPQNRLVFAVNHQGRLVALSRETGMRLWSNDLSAIRRPLVWNDRLFVADVDGNMRALGVEDGLELWRGTISDGLLTAPVRYKDRIYVADNKGRLFSIDPTSGRVMGLDQLGDPVTADPVVVGQEMYIWTNKGSMILMRMP